MRAFAALLLGMPLLASSGQGCSSNSSSSPGFTEGGTDLRAAFDRAGLADRLVLLTPGEAAELAD